MRGIDGIEYCVAHEGICVEGTDYTGEPDSLGCEYSERDPTGSPCQLVTLYVKETTDE